MKHQRSYRKPKRTSSLRPHAKRPQGVMGFLPAAHHGGKGITKAIGHK